MRGDNETADRELCGHQIVRRKDGQVVSITVCARAKGHKDSKHRDAEQMTAYNARRKQAYDEQPARRERIIEASTRSRASRQAAGTE